MMREDNYHSEEEENVYNQIKESVLTPLFSRFTPSSVPPVDRIISTDTKITCYT